MAWRGEGRGRPRPPGGGGRSAAAGGGSEALGGSRAGIAAEPRTREAAAAAARWGRHGPRPPVASRPPLHPKGRARRAPGEVGRGRLRGASRTEPGRGAAAPREMFGL
ncbi:translation initiation factor IF-2-like [Eptesicus fuscus]|uniref:translation initiation factor IF-2-like n=1 Tax=Eptesicus fuscus TaxID=29078 RepID=UPI0024046B42|nr:translation initiation factor IF-2-like [Eptesicus fuscus]